MRTLQMKNNDILFIKHLKYATKVVSNWPKWKREALKITVKEKGKK